MLCLIMVALQGMQQRGSQKMAMHPKALLATQIMVMPVFELREYIHQEIENNPALVLAQDGNMEVGLPPVDDQNVNEHDEEIILPSQQAKIDSISLDQNLAVQETLEEHLIGQLRVQPISEAYIDIGLRLIDNLDAHGFHCNDVHSLFTPEEMELVPDMLYLIRRFDPIGTCVRDSMESLLVQAEILHAPDGATEQIRNWFTSTGNGKGGVIENIDMEGKAKEEFLALLPMLNPYPGNIYSSEPSQYILPDLQVSKDNDRLLIRINDSVVVALDPYFEELASVSRKDKNLEHKFASKQVETARTIISAIAMRQQTILKIAQCIVEHQKKCFLEGLQYIRPLLLKDVAEQVSMSESTVSRVVSRKYVQTSWGVVALRYFFSTAVDSDTAELSRITVLHTIKQIIADAEDKHLTDQAISDTLLKQGIKLARRTVSKYRKIIQENM